MNTMKYNAGARTLHWIIALLIIGNLASGLLHFAIPVHKAIGLTVLVLSLARLGWRMAWKAPPYPASMSRAEVGLAHAVHGVLYLFMIAMPLSGWIIASAGKYPLSWFGVFQWPKLSVVKGSAIYGAGHEFHEIGGWVLLVLVLGHIAAALRHHFMLKDGVLRRML
ncbi:cytochrome B561 [Sphingomonas sp. LH128]|jgi:cytochrome b561|uniref:Cytochrome B561 n=1 Tax=Novosphingobium resinovorum TaxID=158500 RepID=A0A031JV77_9SPHN|nr:MULTISPECIES: cytochrome b [Sphingomonadaceae]EJU11596.1 cytochrome B561 [Sphingomonas sp. LH128]EZP81686.1 Cytochrome B561 [Novosphingobium resinovorum]